MQITNTIKINHFGNIIYTFKKVSICHYQKFLFWKFNKCIDTKYSDFKINFIDTKYKIDIYGLSNFINEKINKLLLTNETKQFYFSDWTIEARVQKYFLEYLIKELLRK